MRRYDVLIVGGGQAARRAALGARAVSPDASLAIIGEEIHPPYERPPLSKAALGQGEGPAPSPTLDSYAAEGIDLILGMRVIRLDRAERQVWTADGEAIGYGVLILATGSRVRPLPFGAEVSDRLLTLRTREDAERLDRALVPGARIAVVGGGFIGLEVATAAAARGADVTVIEAADRILARALPEVVAARVAEAHRRAGIDLRTATPLKGIARAGEGIRLDLGQDQSTYDWAVVGIGVVPNTELAVEAGLEVDDGILVDETGATSDPHIFAAGEVTRHPVHGADQPLRLECWQAAEVQAEAAGRSAAGTPSASRVSPWFWSDQAGLNIQMLGHVLGYDLVERDYGDGSVSYLALDPDGRLAGLVAINAGQDISVARRLIARDVAVHRSTAGDATVPLRRLLS